jgi:hypothetical protein
MPDTTARRRRLHIPSRTTSNDEKERWPDRACLKGRTVPSAEPSQLGGDGPGYSHPTPPAQGLFATLARPVPPPGRPTAHASQREPRPTNADRSSPNTGHRRRQDADSNRHRSRGEERSPERQGPGSSLQIGRPGPCSRAGALHPARRRSGPGFCPASLRQGREGELASALRAEPASSAALSSGRPGLQLDPAARRGALQVGAPLPSAWGRDPPWPCLPRARSLGLEAPCPSGLLLQALPAPSWASPARGYPQIRDLSTDAQACG